MSNTNQGFTPKTTFEPILEPFIDLLEPKQPAINLEPQGALVVPATGCVRLDWEDLPCFTVVEHQYEQWGVLFNNAVAIRPSNPVFSAYSGVMVLLGAPKSGWLEATFIHPVQYVSGFITSPCRIIISAFNRHNQLLAQEESLPMLGETNSKHCITVRLSLHAANIHRVTLSSFSGQLTVDDFCFCGV